MTSAVLTAADAPSQSSSYLSIFNSAASAVWKGTSFVLRNVFNFAEKYPKLTIAAGISADLLTGANVTSYLGGLAGEAISNGIDRFADRIGGHVGDYLERVQIGGTLVPTESEFVSGLTPPPEPPSVTSAPGILGQLFGFRPAH